MLLGVIPGLKSKEKEKTSETPAITLEFWGIDNPDAFKGVLEGYKAFIPMLQLIISKLMRLTTKTNCLMR